MMFSHFFVHLLFTSEFSHYHLLMLVLLFLVVEKLVSVVDPDGYSASPWSGKSISCTSSLFFLLQTNAARIITPVS